MEYLSLYSKIFFILQLILWLKETGIAHFHLNNVMHRRASFNLREVVKEYDGLNSNPIVLGLTPLGAGFIVLIIGLLASTIVFFYELKQAADSRPIREVFRDIQKKREMYKSPSYKRKSEKAELDYNLYESSNLFVSKSAVT